jgi:hypothetical protein
MLVAWQDCQLDVLNRYIHYPLLLIYKIKYCSTRSLPVTALVGCHSVIVPNNGDSPALVLMLSLAGYHLATPSHDRLFTGSQITRCSSYTALAHTHTVALSPQVNYTDWATATCRRTTLHTPCKKNHSKQFLTLQDLRFSHWWLWRMASSGITRTIRCNIPEDATLQFLILLCVYIYWVVALHKTSSLLKLFCHSITTQSNNLAFQRRYVLLKLVWTNFMVLGPNVSITADICVKCNLPHLWGPFLTNTGGGTMYDNKFHETCISLWRGGLCVPVT